jgi:hypothetical protein
MNSEGSIAHRVSHNHLICYPVIIREARPRRLPAHDGLCSLDTSCVLCLSFEIRQTTWFAAIGILLQSNGSTALDQCDSTEIAENDDRVYHSTKFQVDVSPSSQPPTPNSTRRFHLDPIDPSISASFLSHARLKASSP